jgi:drug/metabolite transporter (DMT)-like permease
VGSFSFNGIRFLLGSLSLIPLMLINQRNSKIIVKAEKNKYSMLAGGIAGIILFCGASLQQIGLEETTAGKAAFITGLYIVLVPVLGILLKNRPNKLTILANILALAGLYLLCVTDTFSISRGDLFELMGAFFWAAHILTIDFFSKKADVLKLSFYQFITCSILSLCAAFLTESITWNGLVQAAVPILYGGIFSVGIAYTLQVIGQRDAEPSEAAIILSMETVFAAVGGWLILDEILNLRGIIGCTLMFIGMLLPQLAGRGKGTVQETAIDS